MLTKHRSLLFISVLLLPALWAHQSRAEALDDASIQKFHDESLAAIHDPAATHKLMEERLDPGFTVQSTLTKTIGNNPPETTHGTASKAESIANTDQLLASAKIESIESKIVNIKYSDDHKFAFVSDTTMHSGTISQPIDATHTATVHYQYADGCVDKMTLENAMLKIMQSACTANFVVTK